MAMTSIHAFLCALPLAAMTQWPATARACWNAVAAKYSDAGVTPSILYKLAKAESDLNPRAIGYASNGTRDLGLMQINSTWLPILHQRFGITERDLLDNWCVNLDTGAWILADLFRRHGATWNAIGAYNAACTSLRGDRCAQARAKYAWRVHRQVVPTSQFSWQ